MPHFFSFSVILLANSLMTSCKSTTFSKSFSMHSNAKYENRSCPITRWLLPFLVIIVAGYNYHPVVARGSCPPPCQITFLHLWLAELYKELLIYVSVIFSKRSALANLVWGADHSGQVKEAI